MDDRARKTRTALVRALLRLAPEKGFESLKVEELARAARIGRSTFYGHYADKNDFLDRSFAALLRRMDQSGHDGQRASLLPVRQCLSHMQSERAFTAELVSSGMFDGLLSRAENDLRDIAAANITRTAPSVEASRLNEAAIMLSGAFTALARWWVRDGMTRDVATMQAWFDRFAAAAVAGPERP